MKLKKRLFRAFLMIAVLTVLSVSLCPAAFAREYSDVGFYVEPTEILFSSLEAGENNSIPNYKGTVYVSVPFETLSSQASVMVWFGDHSYICKPYLSSTSGSTAVFVGNGSIYSASSDDTGEPFFITFNTSHTSNCYMVLTDEFVQSLKAENSDSVVFAVQPIKQPGLAGSVTSGLHNSIHWVGQVVNAFISPDGAFSGLLPMFAIIIAIPALILGIKVIRSLIWGA